MINSLSKLFIVTEQYPDLKENTNFIELQKQLLAIEKDIEIARKHYNVMVRENKILALTLVNVDIYNNKEVYIFKISIK